MHRRIGHVRERQADAFWSQYERRTSSASTPANACRAVSATDVVAWPLVEVDHAASMTAATALVELPVSGCGLFVSGNGDR
jgi:hypothetical protein